MHHKLHFTYEETDAERDQETPVGPYNLKVVEYGALNSKDICDGKMRPVETILRMRERHR
jgi:hypothetical protein